MFAAPTAASTSTLTAAPAKENTMHATQNTFAQSVADLVEQRGGHYEPVGAYIDTTPPEYDDLSAYALAAADEAIQAHALGEISDSVFDESFAAALRVDRAPAPVSAPWPFSEADELALEEIQAASRPKAYTPPVNGLTEIEAATLASCRRQEADAEYALMLAEQERDDTLEEIATIDFSGLAPVVEIDFSALYEEIAA